MTVMFMVGRRVPKSWFRRQAGHVVGLITFQENIWMMIKQSLNLAKKKANAAGNIKFILTNDSENEDMNYEIQWIKIMIQGTEEQEKEEYEDCMKLWGPLAKVLTKKELPKDARFSSHFKTKMLNTAELSDAYKKGYGSMQDNNLSNKLLEMGLLTHVKWDKDFEGRPVDIKKDM